MVRTKTQTTSTFDIPKRYIEKPKLREAEIQTEPEPTSPKAVTLVASDHGVDAFTQLDDGTFYDFEAEVLPVVEILAPRIIKVALMEVEEEMYMNRISVLKDAFNNKREKEAAGIRYLDNVELCKQRERADRLNQEKVVLAISQSALAKTKALTYAKTVLTPLSDDVLSALATTGATRPPLLLHLMKRYLPELIHSAVAEFRNRETIHQIDSEYRKLRYEYIPALILEATKMRPND
jgi:hypothetical protein